MKIKSCYLRSLLLAVVVACCTSGTGQEKEVLSDVELPKVTNPPKHVWMYPVIAYKPSQETAARPAVDALYQALAPMAKPIGSETGIGCCLFVHIEPVRINPYLPHYLIVLHPGGGERLASDAEQLALGAKALIQSIHHDTDKGADIAKFPLGIITNLPVTQVEKQ